MSLSRLFQMAHDPSFFEQRIAEALKAQGAKPEHKKMFGGVAFMVNGHMSVGITNKGDFMARFDKARHAESSKWPGAKPMTFGKGDMKGFFLWMPMPWRTRRRWRSG
ncbi:MAG: TfoX/Sxy family protein [Flavobacteriales bacterium]|nr:TfoX/Sxy family protein [Flavobacteriales bacterium]